MKTSVIDKVVDVRQAELVERYKKIHKEAQTLDAQRLALDAKLTGAKETLGAAQKLSSDADGALLAKVLTAKGLTGRAANNFVAELDELRDADPAEYEQRINDSLASVYDAPGLEKFHTAAEKARTAVRMTQRLIDALPNEIDKLDRLLFDARGELARVEKKIWFFEYQALKEKLLEKIGDELVAVLAARSATLGGTLINVETFALPRLDRIALFETRKRMTLEIFGDASPAWTRD